MDLIQELLYTISFSVIVSLLIIKLFSVATSSSCDDDNNSNNNNIDGSIVEEKKIDKEWVVCEEQDFVKLSELGSGVVIKDAKNVGGVGSCKGVDERSEGIEVSDSGGGGLVGSDEGNVVVGESLAVEKEDEVFDDDDDWEGVEATELEKRFGAAVAFMSSKSGGDDVNLVDNEVKVELYGLHRVAIQGSCFEAQPMALKVSARANWNSWKRLENLGREDAMEQYIALLSQHVPDWMGRHTANNDMKLCTWVDLGSLAVSFTLMVSNLKLLLPP